MGQKNFGVAVSGYLDPTGRAFEQAVFQSGKTVLDKELNLSEELSGSASLSRQIAPSGWLTNDHLNTERSTTALFVNSTTANLFVTERAVALVNGWIVDVSYTDNNGTRNHLDFPAPPSGNGAKRTDLVILEVWRKLISASPDTDGKSTGGRIWRNGNVKVPAANDVALNYADDLLDGLVSTETTKRVQIQYRLRVISDVDVFSYPTGIDDPVVVANSVPTNASTPDGTATSFSYENQSANGDSGLWVAGDGNPANTLGTVDGYMYAIPFVATFRRNSSAFDRNLNHNGALAYPSSGRPDGLSSDVFDSNDVADLRQATSFRAWDYQEACEKNFGFLLDNALKTEWMTTGIGGGVDGHTPIWADEIGVLPGDSTTTGDTPGANFIGEFDCTRRFFSDRPIYEVLTFVITPGDPNISTATWQTGTVITINPASIAQYPYSGSISFISRAPSGTRIIDVPRIWIQGATGSQKGAEVGMIYATAPSNSSSPWPVASVSGLGVYPPGNVVITLGAAPAAGFTTEPLYIDLLVAYPPGCGLSRTSTSTFGSSSFSYNNPSALPGSAPVSYSAVDTQSIDPTHREAQLQYLTSNLTYTFSSNSTNNNAKYALPERAKTLVTTLVNGVPASASLDASGRIVTFASAPASGATLSVTYTAVRPYPQSGFQMTIYYQARAPQTVRSALLGTSLTFTPRWVSPFVYTITAGSGSLGEGYPYPYAYVQTGGVLKIGGTWAGEHELDGAVEISVAEFNASTGFLKLPAFIPYTPSPEEVTFTRSPSDTDIEGRSFFPTVAAGYAPNSFAQGMSNDRVHKVILPALMESSVDSSLGPKGVLFLVLFVRWAAFDEENSVKFLTSNNTTTAAVFRVAGNLLNGRS